MCKGCTKSMVSRSIELLKTDENYRIAMFLKQYGWKKPTENSYEVWSGGALLYGKTVHYKPDTTVNAECFAPTLEEINEELKKFPPDEDEINEELESNEIDFSVIRKLNDAFYGQKDINRLETAAVTWVVENLYKQSDEIWKK